MLPIGQQNRVRDAEFFCEADYLPIGTQQYPT